VDAALRGPVHVGGETEDGRAFIDDADGGGVRRRLDAEDHHGAEGREDKSEEARIGGR
jgi:hypothetical protein